MLTITRRQALQLKAVLRRAFGSRGPSPAVCFTADAGTLSVKASSADIAIAYDIATAAAPEALWLPFQCLADCEEKKDEPVQLEATDNGRVTACWRDRNIPQLVQYDAAAPHDADKFPSLPEKFAENPPRLFQAMADAGETCDPDSVRYALGHVQLRGQRGSIGATDGRQLMIQSGFAFPWEGDLLIPRSKIFGSPEIAGDEPVLVGKSGDWVAFRTGPWTIWLAINKDGRFPDISRHIPRPTDATAHCRFSPADVEFLGQTLPRLPCDETYNFPVTLDLNGSIAIRAKGADQPRPTEVVLKGSQWSGEPIRINTNRKYLARAAKLGFQELLIYGNKIPVLCQDEHRQYLWALLEPESVIPPSDDAIRIESPQVDTNHPDPHSKPRRRIPIVSETPTNPTGNGHIPTSGATSTNGHATATNGHDRKAPGRKAELHDTAALIEPAPRSMT